MIAAMDRIEVVFLRSEMNDMVAFLQEQGVVHVEDVPLAMEDYPGYLHRVHLPAAKKTELDALENLQRLLREALPLLSPAPEHDALASASRKLAGEAQDIYAWGNTVRLAHRTLRSLARRRVNLKDNADVLKNYRRVLEFVAPVLANRQALLGETARALILPSTGTDLLDELEKDLIRLIGPECDLVRRGLDRANVAAVILHPAGRGDAVSAILAERGIVPLDVPDRDLRGITVEEALKRIDAKLTEFSGYVERLAAERDKFSMAHGAGLHAIDRAVADRLAQLQVVDHFAESQMIGVVHGWLPTDAFDRLSEAARFKFGARAVVGKLPHKGVDHHRIPTLLRNRPLFRPFQLILQMFDPPTYGTMDPTWLVAVSFIMFYGFILGDAGYGLFVIAVAMWAKKKWRDNGFVHDAMTIAQWMGASSIVWGIVFGEFFGNLPERFLGLEPLFHRMHQPLVLLGVAVGYGLVHIPLALILGVVEGVRHGHREHAQEKLGMLLGLLALIIAVAGLMGVVPGGVQTGLIIAALLFVASIIFLIRAMGAMFAMGVMEIIGLASNVLSYARLMALGLASVVLADLANMVLDLNGVMGILVGIPMAGLIHMLNIGIGVFSPTIHSLRLNYVEFLPKFYEPEGRTYQPFRKELSW